jgi:methionyl-tRNA synthetase
VQKKINKSKKLMKLKVMLDDGERQLVAGIAEHYNPEDLVGKKSCCSCKSSAGKADG